MRKEGWAAVLIAMMTATGALGQDAAGAWHGTLEAGAVSLRLAVHIGKQPAGGYQGTMDSPDQNVAGLPLAAIAVEGGALAFDVPSVHGHYLGRWDPTQRAWVGNWTQGTAMPLTLVVGEAPPSPTVVGLDGDWEGALHAGGATLHLALHIKTGAGGTIASFDSIDQAAMGLPVAALARDGAKVRFEIRSVSGVFEGLLSADAGTIAGTWRQGPNSLPLTFQRRPAGSPQAMLARPQDPVAPFPYRVEKLAFDGGASGVRLAGTLTLPQGAGPFPAVVLIAGSGPQNRDEAILGHKPFWVLADYLTRRGIAVLRYDKRGVAESSGDYAHATSLDFAADAEAAARYLRARPRIDPKKVGLIGHSEGGLVAPLVAAKDPGVAFVVLMAGPGVDGAKILALQGDLLQRATGTSEATIAKSTAMRARLYAAVESAKDEPDALARARAVLGEGAASELPPAILDQQAQQISSDWFRFFLTYDPAPTLRQVHCPVLAISGSKDLQVPPEQNVGPLKAALAANSDATIEVLPGLNHLFQPAKTGGIGEYAASPITIAPVALATVGDWIERRVR